MISLVIPTYHEAPAIEETLRRADRSLRGAGEAFELIVVDDSSSDATAEISEALAPELPVRVLRRAGRLGLASAVVDGWKVARGDVLGVMDGDLQHPPELLTELVRALRENSADLVIASRYVNGGGTADWSWLRRIISSVATSLALLALPGTLAGVTDPMSGMFLVRVAALEGVRLNPTGYKILLEVLARARCERVSEVPYVFNRRHAGSSKLGPRQYLEYLVHVARLARSSRKRELARNSETEMAVREVRKRENSAQPHRPEIWRFPARSFSTTPTNAHDASFATEPCETGVRSK